MILEKKLNNISVSKSSILLLKADFNAGNKIIFNNRLIPTLEAKELIPKEIISE